MVKPYSLKEQTSLEYFKATRMIRVYFAAEVFDKVLRPKDSRPYYSNLKTCYSDVRTLKHTIEKYRISPDDIEYDLTGHLTDETSIRGTTWKELKQSVMEQKGQNDWFVSRRSSIDQESIGFAHRARTGSSPKASERSERAGRSGRAHPARKM